MAERYSDNKHANRVMFKILLAGITPLVIAFMAYLLAPGAELFRLIAMSTQKIPSITSEFNPLMTKMMDVYVKSAPLLALITFTLVFRPGKTRKISNRKSLIKACVSFPFIYTFYVCYVLWSNFELTTAGRPARLMSENNFSLLIVYICLYYCSFFLTYMLCYYPVLVYTLWKER